MTSLAYLAKALRGEKHGDRVSCPGPGHSAKDRSLTVWFEGSRLTCCSFAGDDWRDCMDYVRERCGLPSFEPGADCGEPSRRWDTPNHSSTQISRVHRLAAKTAAAMRIWEESTDPTGTPTETYLKSRGLVLPPEAAGRTIRFHARCPWEGGARVPALIARFSPIENDLGPGSKLPTAIHRIRVDVLSGKDRKRSLGSTRGEVIKLTPDEDVGLGLHLAEGIETSLAIHARGWRPVWACCSEATLRLFPVLAGIECLTIGADHDQAGLLAAQTCAERWAAVGREVLIRWPNGLGDDYADEVRP